MVGWGCWTTLNLNGIVREKANSDAETLLIWGERVLDAKSLDEVWGIEAFAIRNRDRYNSVDRLHCRKRP